jgi:tRNA(Ile)-lysidine synthase
MSLPLAALLKNTIERDGMLHAGDRVAVAVSGGADSIALLLLLEELRESLGLTLCVAHFNHQLRGKDSDADERFVESLARQRGIEFVVGRENVAAAAKRHGWNLEDAARRLRYGFFSKLVANGEATRVATAHTADDQAETVLARLIRGTGLTGLSAIYPVRDRIIRPLLEARRKDLRDYLSSIHQEWREDASNADTRRLRARVREQLLPQLEMNFSPAIVNTLGGLAASARDDERFWQFLVQERCNCIVKQAEGESRVLVADILWPMGSTRLHDSGESVGRNPFRALTQRIIRRLFADISKERGELSRKHVEQVIRFAETGSSGNELELPGRARVRKEFDHLVFSGAGPTQPSSMTSYAYAVDVPKRGSATITVAELGKRFRLKVIDWSIRERETNRRGVILDAERLRPPVILRSWKPGDAYLPSGRRQKRKLSRMLIAGRIAGAQRSLWPVLTSEGRIAWADRMPPAEEFSTSEATRTGLWILEDGG